MTRPPRRFEPHFHRHTASLEIAAGRLLWIDVKNVRRRPDEGRGDSECFFRFTTDEQAVQWTGFDEL